MRWSNISCLPICCKLRFQLENQGIQQSVKFRFSNRKITTTWVSKAILKKILSARSHDVGSTDRKRRTLKVNNPILTSTYQTDFFSHEGSWGFSLLSYSPQKIVSFSLCCVRLHTHEANLFFGITRKPRGTRRPKVSTLNWHDVICINTYVQ